MNKMIPLNRTNETMDKWLIAFDYDHKPYPFDDIHEWVLMCFLLCNEDGYIFETPVIYNDSLSGWDIEKYNSLLKNDGLMVTYYIILLKFAHLIKEIDINDLIKKYLDENAVIVEQYKNGNLKVINQLLGKILKDNKSIDPKKLKAELEILLA